MNQRNKTICCFGELLLRLSPVMSGGFIKDRSMPVFIGGAELNAATALALWNQSTKYVTALPPNYFAEEIVDFLITDIK
ncbi:MAG: sugar kinase, partial [Pedobacter sp.]